MTLFSYAVLSYIFVAVSCYSDEFSDGYQYHRAFPQEVMVDVINNFGLSLLEAHNDGNENNIALSPYGATSVLVALGEGIRGYAVKEIQEATRIPLDISVVRVGLRDIHRHLKSYFIPKEGFLAGLTLSNEKVPLVPRYEEILRFYGYDSESFNNPLYPDAFANSPAINSTSTTPTLTTNNITIQDNDVTTTIKTSSNTEFTTEATQLTASSTVDYIEDRTMTVSDSITMTVVDNISNKSDMLQNPIMSTTFLVDTTHSPSTLKEIDFTSIKSTTPKITTISESITNSDDLSTTESKHVLNSDTEQNQTTVLQLEITTTTIGEIPMTSVTPTETIMIKDVEPLTIKEDTTEKFTSTLAINADSTTSQSNEDLETSDMAGNDVTMKSTITTSSFTTINSDADIIESTTVEAVVNSTTSMDNYISTNLDVIQDTNTMTTSTESESSSTTSSTEINDMTTNALISNVTETMMENVPSTSHLPLDEFSTTTIVDHSSEEVTITTSVTHSISKVTTTYETSSFVSTDFIQDQETSTVGSGLISIEDISTNSMMVTENSLTASTLGSTNDIISTVTEFFPEMSTISMESNSENSTNKALTGESKRDARSVIDYVIARYYDNFPSERDYYERSYKPEGSLSFLVYGKFKETNINFMTYDAVLPIAYIPVIEALALSFPLDSKEYYLLLLLPVHETGIDKLVYDLKRKTSLRRIIASLRYAHVKAIIPSFMLKGYVVLTPTLQKLGIRRVFEPRHTDFSLMTKERDIYVTNIEQAVTVTIRNYVDPENLPNYRNLQQLRPIEFKADHPFLYFVMDTDIHVNLMAGKIVNPLNSRIR